MRVAMMTLLSAYRGIPLLNITFWKFDNVGARGSQRGGT